MPVHFDKQVFTAWTLELIARKNIKIVTIQCSNPWLDLDFQTDRSKVTYIYIYMYICKFIHVCAHMHIYVHRSTDIVCTHAYDTYTCVYTHTHTQYEDTQTDADIFTPEYVWKSKSMQHWNSASNRSWGWAEICVFSNEHYCWYVYLWYIEIRQDLFLN